MHSLSNSDLLLISSTDLGPLSFLTPCPPCYSILSPTLPSLISSSISPLPPMFPLSSTSPLGLQKFVDDLSASIGSSERIVQTPGQQHTLCSVLYCAALYHTRMYTGLYCTPYLRPLMSCKLDSILLFNLRS
jgi:hypothetical protein